MADLQTLEVSIQGMDCAECTRHVQHAIAGLPGVQTVEVYLTAEKAVVSLDPERVDMPAIQKAVAGAGYQATEAAAVEPVSGMTGRSFTRPLMVLLGTAACHVAHGRAEEIGLRVFHDLPVHLEL